jgi:short-subunit dehydrogenase
VPPSADEVVLVTGASSGLGLVVAQQFARRGAHLVLVARGSTALQEAALRCAHEGARSTQVLPADVREADQVEQVVSDVLDRHGRIDVVVNSAGVVAAGVMEEVPAQVYDGVIRTNLLGSANVARAVIPVMREQRSGSLVLVGSLMGHISVPYFSPYVASKWGVRGLARQLRTELRGSGVRVGYVAPGALDTPIYQQAANYLGSRLRPPPPVSPPLRMAQRIVDVADGRLVRLDLGLGYLAANQALQVGFELVPAPVYDAVVSRVLVLTALDRGKEPEPPPGNVFTPQQLRPNEHGTAGSAVLSVARNLVALGRRAASV